MGRGWIVGGSVVVPVLVTAGAIALRVAPLYLTTPRGSFAAPLPLASQGRVQSPAPTVQSPAAELSPDRLFARISLAVAKVWVYDAKHQPMSQGSGFFISPNGLLITNFHVIQGGSSARVQLPGRDDLPVEGALAVNPDIDLALLKVTGEELPSLHVAGNRLPPIGTKVYAVGSPEGFTNTLSEGLVSGVRVSPQGSTWLQTTAPISHGSSGGPLLAPDGSVLGVTSASFVAGQSLNFAIPAADVSKLIARRGELVPIRIASVDPNDRDDMQAIEQAQIDIRAGRFRDAADRLDQIRDRQRDNPLFWFAIGQLAYNVRNLPAAVENLRRSIKLRNDFAPAYLYLGFSLEDQRRHREALDAFTSASKLDPEDFRARLGAGQAWSNLGKDAEAVRALNESIRLNPKEPFAYELIGRSYFRLGQYGASADAFAHATRLNPRDVRGFLGLGDAQFRIGEYDKARDAYETVIRLQPTNAYAFLYVGYCSYGQHDQTGAISAWQIAARLDPTGRIGAEARQNLAKVGATQ